MTNKILDAIAIAYSAHLGQKDKAGNEYIEHVLSVSKEVEKEEEKMVALLHDVVEDSDYSLEDLKRYDFPDTVIEAVDCITKRESEKYKDYLERVKCNKLAREVKIKDIGNNMQRLKNLEEEEQKRLHKKYNFALERLW